MSDPIQEQEKVKTKKKRPQCNFCGQEITIVAKYCLNCGNEIN